MKKLYVVLVLIGLVFAVGSAFAQPGPGPNPLARLNRQLAKAGAPALTAAQESGLTGLITAFLNAHQPPQPNPTVQAAQNALATAVLNQDKTGAAAQVTIISNAQADRLMQIERDRADFGIEVAKILRTNGDAVALLIKSIGVNGTARLLMSLAPPRGPGMGAGQPAPGMGGGGRMGGLGRQFRSRQ
jgi:hypothetical protein